MFTRRSSSIWHLAKHLDNVAVIATCPSFHSSTVALFRSLLLLSWQAEALLSQRLSRVCSVPIPLSYNEVMVYITPVVVIRLVLLLSPLELKIMCGVQYCHNISLFVRYLSSANVPFWGANLYRPGRLESKPVVDETLRTDRIRDTALTSALSLIRSCDS